MPRILILLILCWVLYVVVKRFIASMKSSKTPTKQTMHTEKIVACSQCGLHIPESESHMLNDTIYCNNPECNKQEQHEH